MGQNQLWLEYVGICWNAPYKKMGGLTNQDNTYKKSPGILGIALQMSESSLRTGHLMTLSSGSGRFATQKSQGSPLTNGQKHPRQTGCFTRRVSKSQMTCMTIVPGIPLETKSLHVKLSETLPFAYVFAIFTGIETIKNSSFCLVYDMIYYYVHPLVLAGKIESLIHHKLLIWRCPQSRGYP